MAQAYRGASNAFRDLKSSLQSPSVQSALDQSSEKKGNLTWDGVAFNVLKVVSTEVDRLSERGLRGGARSAASAGGDLLQAAALLRTLVQSASRSESHLLAALMPRCRCHIP
ncbi:hypothetical protein IscW_ISCW012279 [Ixodes scapularis]|uniref:Uncharacterized protein n=1 Tax=Ixodes scapularis TaxID=6945 RepID=B7QCD8_IXOSC|nr:hypothetical protein IscW_ISCW012279 [Ixodes scapularis]|eukprot:XP_002413202.1 hypothetical protein IscW_ISCW012279 [Ixodes scapularis]